MSFTTVWLEVRVLPSSSSRAAWRSAIRAAPLADRRSLSCIRQRSARRRFCALFTQRAAGQRTLKIRF